MFLFGMGLVCCKSPEGFNEGKIRSDFAFVKEEKASEPSEGDLQNITGILSQEFQYLGSGAQCYAFISSDNEYVIKFFKMRHLTPKYWLSYIPIPWLEKYRFEKIDHRERKRQETFDSFKIAFEELKEQTGLVYIHLQKTRFYPGRITVVDKTGKKHIFSLKGVPFILQKKATMIYSHITELMNKGDTAGSLDALSSVLYLVKQRCEKGFADRDGGVSANYGFIDGHPVHIDIGRIVRDESIKDPSNYLMEVIRVSKKIDFWLQRAYPQLCPLFQEEVQKIVSGTDEVASF